MSFLDRLLGRDRGRAVRQEGEPLDREDDPRGGRQSDAYRTADPRDVVEEGGTVMSGPGGAAQQGRTPSERGADER